jgi:hypothetical protein
MKHGKHPWLRFVVAFTRVLVSRPRERVAVDPFFMIAARDAVYCANCRRISRSEKSCRGCDSRALYPVTKFIPELGEEARVVIVRDPASHSGC